MNIFSLKISTKKNAFPYKRNRHTPNVRLEVYSDVQVVSFYFAFLVNSLPKSTFFANRSNEINKQFINTTTAGRSIGSLSLIQIGSGFNGFEMEVLLDVN